MKLYKIICTLSKEGRRLIKKEKLVFFRVCDNPDEEAKKEIPENLIDKIETTEYDNPICYIKPGDIVKISNGEIDIYDLDSVIEVNYDKGTIKLKNSNLKYNIFDGSCKTIGRGNSKIEPETSEKRIREYKEGVEKIKLVDEILEIILNNEDIFYNMEINSLKSILDTLKNYKK